MSNCAPTEDRSRLAAQLEAVKAEIASYPGPVAGCDAQFNHLLEERQRLLDALSQEER